MDFRDVDSIILVLIDATDVKDTITLLEKRRKKVEKEEKSEREERCKFCAGKQKSDKCNNRSIKKRINCELSNTFVTVLNPYLKKSRSVCENRSDKVIIETT